MVFAIIFFDKSATLANFQQIGNCDRKMSKFGNNTLRNLRGTSLSPAAYDIIGNMLGKVFNSFKHGKLDELNI